MRHGVPLAIAFLLAGAGLSRAQELVPLPTPDPAPAGSVAPPLSGPPSGPPQPYVPPPPPPPPGPSLLYPPPPGLYPPPAAPPLFVPPSSTNPNFWAGVEGLLWWTKNQPVAVPLVTTGPASQGANAGSLGAPGTTPLGGPLDFGPTGGVRLFAGGWFNAAHTVGMNGSLFILGQQTAGFGVGDRSGAGNFVINEPVSGAPFITQVSAPGLETGSVFVNATSRFGGGDVNFLGNLYRGNCWTVNVLGGYRYLQLDESLSATADSTMFVTTTYSDNAGNVLATATPGSGVTVIDRFSTRNQFNGGQVGAQVQYWYGRLLVGGTAKVALGDTYETVTVGGTTTVFPVNGAPVPLSGGNFATLQSGRYATNHFAVAPEARLTLGYQVTPCLRAQVGYDFLFLSSVARPGNQIDNTFDGATHPLVPMTSSSFWAQGLTLGLQFNF